MYEAADHRPRDHHRASRHVDRQSKSKLIINNLDFAVTDDDIEVTILRQFISRHFSEVRVMEPVTLRNGYIQMIYCANEVNE